MTNLYTLETPSKHVQEMESQLVSGGGYKGKPLVTPDCASCAQGLV